MNSIKMINALLITIYILVVLICYWTSIILVTDTLYMLGIALLALMIEERKE